MIAPKCERGYLVIDEPFGQILRLAAVGGVAAGSPGVAS